MKDSNKARIFGLEIFLVSFAGLLLEISYTRIFSFKLFYYFTYVILAVGMIGISAGAVAFLTSKRLREADPRKLIPISAISGGACVLLGYFIVALIQINVQATLMPSFEIVKMAFAMICLASVFFSIGIIIGAIFSNRVDLVGKLYAIDLFGAALGCGLSVPIIEWLDPPRTVILAGLSLCIAGLFRARAYKKVFRVGALITALLLIVICVPSALPDPVASKSKGIEKFTNNGTLRYSKWNPVFRVDVGGASDDSLVVLHDGAIGSGLWRFNGDLSTLKYFNGDLRSVPFALLSPNPNVLIIGAAGGHEVLASLYFGAGHVTAVELNPVTYSLVKDKFADFTGHLTEHPKVTYVNGDARWFLEKSQEKFDLIWFAAPDSYAALGPASASPFVLSESYLFTVEMHLQSLRHLSSGGIICSHLGERFFLRKPNRTTRFITTMRAAFKEYGIEDFEKHVVVATAPLLELYHESMALFSKSQISPDMIKAFENSVSKVKGGQTQFVPGTQMGSRPVNNAIHLSGQEFEKWITQYPYKIDPVRDDSPFFWHFVRFKDAIRFQGSIDQGIRDPEDSAAENILMNLLFVTALLGIPLLLFPFFVRRRSLKRFSVTWNSLAFFSLTGLGFEFLVIALTQKLTLLFGYPTYALSITLSTMFVSLGLGGLVAMRVPEKNTGKMILVVWAALSVAVILGQLTLVKFGHEVIGGSLALRIAFVIAIVTPAGLCAGIFTPTGLRVFGGTSEVARQRIVWGFAVNSFFCVIASVLTTIFAMTIGFNQVILCAIGAYFLAASLLLYKGKKAE